MREERAVFRSLLRAARGYDRHPQHLATLLGWPSCVFDRGANRVVRQAVTQCPLAEDAVWEACGGSTEFSHPAGRAAAAVRRHRRRMGALGLAYLPGARVLLGRFEDAQRSADRVLAAAARQEKTVLPPLELEFISGPRAGQRLVLGERAADRVEGKLSLAEPADAAAAGRGPAPGPPGLPPLLGPAAPAPAAAPGAAAPPLRRVGADDPSPCSVGQLLIAHPLSLDQDRSWTSRQPSMDQAVMLITAADVGSGHVRGVALNSPARGSLRSVLAAWSCRSGEGGIVQIDEDDRRLMEALEPLLDAPLLSGGELVAGSLSDSITWLHTLGHAVPGAREVAPSVWVGGDRPL
ncbi:unnamed protein product [Prorocentrum cordatum]|uniref:Uncharacterized protein n=1 Tax=Prorocentrum cordatum TaxID=2364126 RepID=A0ABN9SWJ7_9DINO|nr:unnamed protein product [Polarella glacialis]